MDKEVKELQEKISKYEDIVTYSEIDIEKATMALQVLLDEYDWDYEPTLQKAMKTGFAKGKEIDECTEEEKFSYQYIYDYKKIMWLVRVAFDYCLSASNNITSVQTEA